MNLKAKTAMFSGTYLCKPDLDYTCNYFFANKNYFLRAP